MAQPPADNSPDKQSPVADPLMPDEDTLLEYINSCPTPPSFLEIAKAFKIGQNQRVSLRRLLRDLETRGLLAGNRRAIAALPTTDYRKNRLAKGPGDYSPNSRAECKTLTS